MTENDQTLGTFDEPARPRDTPKTRALDDPNLGRRIGPYRVERLLDRGGMGAVYLATRQDDFEQRVALKLVHPELQTAEVLRRFAAERQILARLEYPHIARIFDGGTTNDALPYFVMEYVEGVPIDRYSKKHGLSVEQRLELFLQVCAAVHFAHQNLVVHRDLKPSNILVTAEGIPKLLDFGIAKILAPADEGDGGGSAGSGRHHSAAHIRKGTDGGKGPLTPAYASPEQLLGEAITTASDVYSLGVLLYQLLSGQPPYRLGEVAPIDWIDLICRRDPTRPSLAARASNTGRRLGRRGGGDLDAIVLQAMHKKPRERYASALQLAEDIERHLADLPVEAHPARWTYRASKFARRHKLALAVAGLVVVFAVTVTALWRQAVGQRATAERAQVRAEEVSEFLEDLFLWADPDAAPGEAVTVRQALDHGREKLAGELLDEPEIRADLLGTLGMVYQNLGFTNDARQLKEEALATRRAADPSDRHALAVNLNNLGRTLYLLGELGAAIEHHREALAMWQRLGDDANTALALGNLAALEIQRGEPAAAVELYRQTLEINRRLYDAEDARVVDSIYGLGAGYRVAGDPLSAEPLLRRALLISSSNLGDEHSKVVSIKSSLGQALHALGRLDEAREHLESVLATRRRLLEEGDARIAVSEKNLAALLLEAGAPEIGAAGELLERALVNLRRNHPVGDWRIADAESLWGRYLLATGRTAEAEPILLASAETLAAAKGEEDLRTRAARQRLADFYDTRGDEQKAAEVPSAALVPEH